MACCPRCRASLRSRPPPCRGACRWGVRPAHQLRLDAFTSERSASSTLRDEGLASALFPRCPGRGRSGDDDAGEENAPLGAAMEARTQKAAAQLIIDLTERLHEAEAQTELLRARMQARRLAQVPRTAPLPILASCCTAHQAMLQMLWKRVDTAGRCLLSKASSGALPLLRQAAAPAPAIAAGQERATAEEAAAADVSVTRERAAAAEAGAADAARAAADEGRAAADARAELAEARDSLAQAATARLAAEAAAGAAATACAAAEGAAAAVEACAAAAEGAAATARADAAAAHARAVKVEAAAAEALSTAIAQWEGQLAAVRGELASTRERLERERAAGELAEARGAELAGALEGAQGARPKGAAPCAAKGGRRTPPWCPGGVRLLG
jgi:chemotaxis protein histidine kinase CheA